MNHIALRSPAKLNLFLHITKQRDDAYHDIQTVFQLINFCDNLTFTKCFDPNIRLITPLMHLPTKDNLIFRAAKLLQNSTECRQGCDITIEKKIPMGAGLGGGSSNAATTLLALNKLWDLRLSLDELSSLGQQLGADIPVFIHGHTAWAEGTGNVLTPMILKPKWYVLITPPVHIDTKTLYHSVDLQRNCPPMPTASDPHADTFNVFEPVVRAAHPLIDDVFNWLNEHASAKLTGTGSTVFATFDTREKAGRIASLAKQFWPTFLTEGLNHSPVHVKLCAS